MRMAMDLVLIIWSVVTLAYGHDPTSQVVCKEDGQLHPSPICNHFYKCAYGIPVPQDCPGNLLYNPKTQQCDWPHNVDCEGRIVTSNKRSIDGKDKSDSVVCKKDGQLHPSPICNHFYKCAYGIPVPQDCPVNLLYNPKTQQCDWPHNVDCEDRIVTSTKGIVDDKDKSDSVVCKEDGQLHPSPICNHFYKCAYGIPVPQDCPVNLLYNPKTQQCDWPHNVDCEGRIVTSTKGTVDDKDKSDSVICTEDGQLHPSPICNHFYKCAYGIPVPQDCPGNLLYNPKTQQCDWPHNVDCEGRIVTSNKRSIDDKDKSDSVVCKEDGQLHPSPICNHFYKCAYGIPVPQDCPVNLLYNPKTQQCDWPHNVDCEDRIVTSTKGIVDDKDKSDSVVCKEDGQLHPSPICNHFYKCAYGIPVPQDCPGNLLYNPKTQQCDWPHNVDCEGRIVTSSKGSVDDNVKSDSVVCKEDGQLHPSPICNHFYKCAYGIPVPQDCPVNLLYNPKTQQCDWPHNVDCEGRIVTSSKGSVDDNVKSDSVVCKEDGQLHPSPICNHFYKCAYGIPVPQDCPGNLLYNPKTQQCDWPHNVDCEGRIVTSSKGSVDDNVKSDSVVCKEDGQLHPSPICNHFYKCAYGIPVPQDCPVNLLYNPKTQQCDWPHNVDCEGRIVTSTKGSGNRIK